MSINIIYNYTPISKKKKKLFKKKKKNKLVENMGRIFIYISMCLLKKIKTYLISRGVLLGFFCKS